jgi:GH18 family chitinase
MHNHLPSSLKDMNIKLLRNFAVIISLFVPISCSKHPAPQRWSMGYWTGYDGDPESALVWGGITHIIHWGTVHQNPDGNLSFLCSNGSFCTQSAYITFASAIVRIAHAKNVKVILGLSEPNFSSAISSGLGKYAANVMKIVSSAGYDGIDVNWEASQDWTQYASLLTSLRASLGSKILSGTTYGENNAFWATQTSNGNADRVNFMTFDMQGSGKPYSWFNSALYSDSCNCVLSWDLDRSRLMSAGVPAGKVNLGVPFYGYLETGVGGPRQKGQSASRQVNYKTAANSYKLSSAAYDSVAHEPWIAVDGSSWIGFENAQSITDKVNYAETHSLGGWIIFNLSGDYLPSQNPAHPLMAAIATAMHSEPRSRH